jgi:hypothetical protein
MEGLPSPMAMADENTEYFLIPLFKLEFELIQLQEKSDTDASSSGKSLRSCVACESKPPKDCV